MYVLIQSGLCYFLFRRPYVKFALGYGYEMATKFKCRAHGTSNVIFVIQCLIWTSFLCR